MKEPRSLDRRLEVSEWGSLRSWKQWGKARRAEVGKRETAVHQTLAPSSPGAEITPSLCKRIQGRKPLGSGGKGPEASRRSSCGSFYPWSCEDTPQWWGKTWNSTFGSWEQTEVPWCLRTHNTGVMQPTQQSTGDLIHAPRKSRSYPVTQFREWATQLNVNFSEVLFQPDKRGARSFSSVSCVVSFERVLPSNTGLFPD